MAGKPVPAPAAGPQILETIRQSSNASPYYRLLGMTVESLGQGRARLRMPVSEKLFHPLKIVHGGALVSLADSAIIHALLSHTAPRLEVTTVELKVNFIRPVQRGELVAEARLLHQGRRTAVGEVEIVDQQGQLIAKVMATCMVLGEETR